MISRVGLSATIIVICMLSACTDQTAPSTSASAFDELVVEALADARAGLAHQAQIEALERALRHGDVPDEDYLAQKRAALDCMSASGLEVSDVREIDAGGYLTIEALITAPAGMADDAMLAIADNCNFQHSLFLELIYLQQPRSLEAWFANIEAHRSQLIACFAEFDVVVPHDATMEELFQANEEAFGISVEQGRIHNCMHETGAFGEPG